MLTLIHIQNGNATISVVHNGIIENYMKLREWLTDKRVTNSYQKQIQRLYRT